MKNGLIISLIFLLFSCKKEENIHIVALNPVTGEHYAGLTYYLVQQKTTSNGEENTTLKTGTLNSNGEAIFTIKLNRKHAYVIRVEEPENTCYNKSIQMYLDSPYDEDGKFTFEFAPCGNLKFSIHNVGCIDGSDLLKYKRIWTVKNESTNTNSVNGCYQYEGQYFTLPVGEYRYEWEVTKNGITSFYDSTFVINENQFFDFTINY